MRVRAGQRESVRRTFTQSDFDRFAALSGDDNPIHVDAEFAAQTRFGRPVAHGMLLYGAVCAALGHALPGPGTLQLEQELKFPSPTYTGEEVSIELEVTELRPDAGLAELSTLVIKPDGNVGLQGRTLVRVPNATGDWGLMRPFRRSDDATAPEGASHKGLDVGQSTEASRTFSKRDLEEYADLTGDTNPVHTDAAYARGLGLGGPIIPGGLIGGMFSHLLGTQLPGFGTNYLKQLLCFPAFGQPDWELTASVEIVRIRPQKRLVNLRTICATFTGEVVCHGEALVLVSDVQPLAERG